MRNWDDARKATLKAMWLGGSTSGEIAAALGDTTRNAVMGMANRMGLLRSAEHDRLSTARRSGCCAVGWSRTGERIGDGPAANDDVAPPPVETTLEATTPLASAPDDVAPPPAEAALETTPPLASAPDAHDAVPAAPLADAEDVRQDLEAPEDRMPPASMASDRMALIRSAAARRTSKAPSMAKDRAAPSARPWSPASSSRMPPRKSDVAPPAQVVISSGVMSSVGAMRPGTAQWRDVFDVLKQLTGAAYDERIPGHGAALVAIATVIARGDPRSVLAPAMPEPTILRFMRRFAEKGVVVAGKPPSRWTEDVEDRAFYDEMLELAAA